jgi:glycosyltransferase involved in cell wall biosynthesis
MAAAAVFVSSSTGEGFPNVVAEALALGGSIVATDCPGDTAELLGHGKWGRLVPVGDPGRMAVAILAALGDPNPPDGRIRAADFSPASAAEAYLKVLLPGLGTEASKTRQAP